VTGYTEGMLNLFNLFGVERLAHLSQFHIVLFHGLHFHVLSFGPSFSRPAISCPAHWSVNFTSVIFTSSIFSAPVDRDNALLLCQTANKRHVDEGRERTSNLSCRDGEVGMNWTANQLSSSWVQHRLLLLLQHFTFIHTSTLVYITSALSHRG